MHGAWLGPLASGHSMMIWTPGCLASSSADHEATGRGVFGPT